MGVNINCIYNNDGAWCKNKNIKRSLFGIGARICIVYPYEKEKCIYQEKFPFPKNRFAPYKKRPPMLIYLSVKFDK